MNRRRFRNACALAAAACAGSAAAQRPSIHLRTAALPPSLVVAYPGRGSLEDWPKYCGNLAMTGVAEGERLISPGSVGKMAAAWTDTLPGAIASSPIVAGGRVYVGDWSGTEWVVDADTGAAIASAYLGRTTSEKCNPSVIGITSAPHATGDVLYLAGGDDAFYALDGNTLLTIWRTPLGDNSPDLGGYYGWCSPAMVGGTVYQGVSSNCDNPFVQGRVDALDAATGAITGSVDLSEDPADRSHYGSGVWTSPAVDLAAGDLFVTTASATHYGDGHAYSVLRLALGDLTVEDSWKLPAEDFALAPDADWGSSPTLFTDPAGRPLVGAGEKNGYYYAFRRDDLSAGPVWKTRIAVPGECPQCGHGTISTAAFDGTRLYVGGGAPLDYRALGAVTALDPSTGAVLWTATAAGPVLSPISFANGVVFAAGGRSGIALDAATGALLWKIDAAAPLYGGIAISRGRIYFGDVAGDLYAFAAPIPLE